MIQSTQEFSKEKENKKEQDKPEKRICSKLYHGLMNLCAGISALLFCALALLVFADVVLRNTAQGGLSWSVEVTEYMLTIATFVAAPWLLYTNDHIRVDVFLRALPSSIARPLEALTDLLGLLICVTLAWQVNLVTRDAWVQGGMVFKILIFPEWCLFLPMSFSFVLLGIEFCRRLQRSLQGRMPRREEA